MTMYVPTIYDRAKLILGNYVIPEEFLNLYGQIPRDGLTSEIYFFKS